ncbi:MAG: 2-oxo acid dehydrogenase subunit E2, partial [Actinomycetota bacterium]
GGRPTAPSPAPAANGAHPVAATGVGGRILASPNARRIAAERGIELALVAGTGPGGRIVSEDVPPTAPPSAPGAPGIGAVAPVGPSGQFLATPAARSLAALLGVDLAQVAATGPDPRIDRQDVAAHVRARLVAGPVAPAPPAAPSSAAPAPPAAPAPGGAVAPLPPASQTPSSVVPLRGMRGTIAQRMSESIHSMAQLTLTMDVDMDGVVTDRQDRKQRTDDGGAVPGYTDYIIAATAQALIEHPEVNSQVTDDGVALLPAVHVGMAVAVDDGLLVPVIHNTLGYEIDALAAETTRLAVAARERNLTVDEMQGGTFSVTALGMFDVDAFTPIINAPNTAILGVGRLRDDVAWSDDGSPERARRLTLSLTWDHRAFDGAPAARFVQSIKRRLEAYRA